MREDLPKFEEGDILEKKIINLKFTKQDSIFNFFMYSWVVLLVIGMVSLLFLKSISNDLNFTYQDLQDELSSYHKEVEKLTTELTEMLSMESLKEIIKELGFDYHDNIIPLD